MQVVKTDSSTPNPTNFGGIRKYNDTNAPFKNREYRNFPQKPTSTNEGDYNKQNNLIKLPNSNVNMTDLSIRDVTALLKTALDTIDELEQTAGYNVYGSLEGEHKQKLKEAEDKLIKSQNKFNLFKYYSFVWLFSIVLLGFFVLMFIGGIFDSFTSIVGVVAVTVGMFGAYLDWKDKEKSYDF